MIRLYILSIHTSWAGVVRFWYICPLLSRHSFAWKPPSSQPASEGNERRLICITSLLVFHRIRYYIPVTHAFVPQSYPLSVLHYQRVVLHLRYSIVQCTSHWNHTVLYCAEHLCKTTSVNVHYIRVTRRLCRSSHDKPRWHSLTNTIAAEEDVAAPSGTQRNAPYWIQIQKLIQRRRQIQRQDKCHCSIGECAFWECNGMRLSLLVLLLKFAQLTFPLLAGSSWSFS